LTRISPAFTNFLRSPQGSADAGNRADIEMTAGSEACRFASECYTGMKSAATWDVPEARAIYETLKAANPHKGGGRCGKPQGKHDPVELITNSKKLNEYDSLLHNVSPMEWTRGRAAKFCAIPSTSRIQCPFV
jgi:hypothetical protein